VYVLDRCLTTNAPFIGIFEDDILFADGWMAKTLKALIELNPTYDPSRDQTPFEPTTLESSWLYLRLFYTETFIMWGENDFAYRNIYLIFATAITIGFLSLFFARRLVPRLQLDYGTIAVICLVTIPAFTGLYFMIGKYSIRPLRGLVPMDTGGCCSQALIYSRQHASQVMEYLQEQRSGQTDLMIEDFAAKANLHRFALAPQQLQHIGIRSSRGAPELNAQSTWAFWFEENNAKKLKSEHEHYLADENIGRLLQIYE
jgi:GR25 family glycosyltransferase involved in LPS biosynthesis